MKVGHESQRDSRADAAREFKGRCNEKGSDAGHMRSSGLGKKPRGLAEPDEADPISGTGLNVTGFMKQEQDKDKQIDSGEAYDPIVVATCEARTKGRGAVDDQSGC